MADCSKTEVYISESKRMCDYYSDNNFGSCCEDCPFYPSFCLTTPSMKPEHAKEAINIVQKWSDEHPEPKPKTYADMFFEKFPKQTLEYTNPDWKRRICRVELFGGMCKHGCCEKCWDEQYPKQEENNG